MIPFIGIVVSLVIEVIKQRFGTSSLTTRCLLVFGALLVAALYTLIKDTAYMTVALEIGITAAAFHNFVIRIFTEK